MRDWCWKTAALRCPPQNVHNWLVILKGEHLSSEATPPSVHCFPWGDGREDVGTNEQLWQTLKEVISDLTPTKLKRQLDSARENRLCISEHKRRAVFSSFPRLHRSVFWFKGWDILAEIRGEPRENKTHWDIRPLTQIAWFPSSSFPSTNIASAKRRMGTR